MWVGWSYCMIIPLPRNVTVSFTPVESHLLFLLLIEPDQLLSGAGYKVKQAVQVSLPLTGAFLQTQEHKRLRRTVLTERAT